MIWLFTAAGLVLVEFAVNLWRSWDAQAARERVNRERENAPWN